MNFMVRTTRQRQQCSSVLMLALQTPAVLLLIGIIPRVSAGYMMTSIMDVVKIMMSHTLKSSDNVVVREGITCFTEFSFRVA